MLRLTDVKGVGDAVSEKLRGLGITSVFGLLSFLPSKYIDLRAPISIAEAQNGQHCLLEGQVVSVSEPKKFGKRGFHAVFKDTLASGNIYFKVFFFNRPYIRPVLEVGAVYRLFAKPDTDGDSFSAVNPIFERADKINKLDGVYTVYPLRGSLGQNTFKNIVYSALLQLNSLELEGKFAAINRKITDNFMCAHRPKSIREADEALNSLAALDVGITLSIYRKTRNSAQKNRKVFYKTPNSIIESYINAMDFTPTHSQIKAFNDICSDISSELNMSRILNGDVGSGKTAVAFFALYLSAASGYQAAMIAPTEILAKQHFGNLSAYAEKLGFKCALLTSSASAAERKKILSGIKSGDIKVAVGTQSLLGEDVEYRNLSLAVIDEQHRFGVNDRAKLEKKGACDILSLTATPIPRSLALTFYEDIAISRIEKRIDAQTNVITVIERDIDTAVDKIISACERGKQGFIVCPAIKDSEGFDIFSIESFIKDFSESLNRVRTAVLHGKFSDEEKENAMRGFTEREIDLLVATSVIEVGIDTQAHEILILNADRFGLASLHQLRGRVGRDGSEAHCYLHCGKISDRAEERLRLLCRCNDGQTLAERDFELRGAGDFIGTQQSGVSRTAMFGLDINAGILEKARQIADTELCEFSKEELLALTRTPRSRAEEFLQNIEKVTLNS